MINLEDFANGALAEKFNIALKDILENITDPNTNHATKRRLTIDLTFQPDEARELSMVAIETKTKLAQKIGVATKILIDRDGRGGIIASEYRGQIKGQQYLEVDENTGEVKDSKREVDTSGIKLIK